MTTHQFLDLANSTLHSGFASYRDGAYVQTTDATATTLWSVSVSEQTAITILALVTGLLSTHGETIGGYVHCTLRRDGGGNVTVVGSADVTSDEDSSGTPSFTVDADTTNQLARLRVTGEAAKTIDWIATVDYQIITT